MSTILKVAEFSASVATAITFVFACSEFSYNNDLRKAEILRYVEERSADIHDTDISGKSPSVKFNKIIKHLRVLFDYHKREVLTRAEYCEAARDFAGTLSSGPFQGEWESQRSRFSSDFQRALDDFIKGEGICKTLSE